jgi:CHAT domain-containing protein
VLHWQSVRPVPTVTIDFGDGRKLERTLTGNSIHYILDSQARTIDALPGLYGPKAFLRALAGAETVFKSLALRNAEERNILLSRYYSQQHNKISAAWTIDTQKIGGKAPEGFRVVEGNNGEALLISPLAITKAVSEANVLRAMVMAGEELGKITDEGAWRKIAQLHSSDAVLDERSISLIKHQNPNLTERELAQLLQKFQDSIALDTVRNEYLMHTKLYTWIVKDPIRDNVEKLNEQVYAKLFLTPNSDPWLGLFSADVYTALDNGGVTKQ